MSALFERPSLSIVPDLPPERWESVYDRAGAMNVAAVDRYLRQKFGERALSIACKELFVFERSDDECGTAINHSGCHVAAFYLGVEDVATRRQYQLTRLEVIDPRPLPIAVFATGMEPPMDLSERQYRRIVKNDRDSLASLYGRIGVPLDQPVNISPLRDTAREEGELPPAQLRVVQ